MNPAGLNPRKLAQMAGVVASLWLAAPAAAAQGDDSAKRAAARELGQEAIEAYNDGDYEEALSKFDRAYAAVKAPSLGRWTALCMIKLGSLVEAAQRYLEVTRLPVNVGDSELQLEAKRASTNERAELLARIPKLRLKITGAVPDDVSIRVDGTAIDASMLESELRVNPGDHVVVASSRDFATDKTVSVEEGQSKTVVLLFPSEGAAEDGEAVVVEEEEEEGDSPDAVTAEDQPQGDEDSIDFDLSSFQQPVGWGALALGSVGLVAGTVTGVIAVSKKSKLDDGDCFGNACGPAEHDDVDAYNDLRTYSTLGFVIGGIATAAGAALLLTAPEEAPAQDAKPLVAPWMGLGVAGVAGRVSW
jgi:hypothetical protein